MAKYDPLRDSLMGTAARVTLSFDEIADLVGGLPLTAYQRQEWWSNNDDRHVQAAAWLAAGMKVVHADLSRRIVSFSPIPR